MTDRPARRLSRDLRIANELGLHARAAAKIAKIAGEANAGVWITKGADRVDAASIIDILTLSCAKGTLITLSVDDPEDVGIVTAIERLVETGFGD